MEDFKTGYFLASGNAVNVILGWVPDFVTVICDMESQAGPLQLFWQKAACEAAASGSAYGWVKAFAAATDNLELAASGSGIRPFNTSGQYAMIDSPIAGRGKRPTVVSLYTVSTVWTARSATHIGSIIQPTTKNGFLYECTGYVANTGSAEPTWPTKIGDSVVEATSLNTFTCIEHSMVRGGGKGFTIQAGTQTDGDKVAFAAWRTDKDNYMGDADQGDLRL